MAEKKVYGAVEAGGTKMVCAYGSSADDLAEVRFPTGAPAETLAKVIDFFRSVPGGVCAIGYGSFGPLCLDRNDPLFGFVTETPKPFWRNTCIVGELEKALNVKVGFDTDVNAAAVGEQFYGAGRGLSDFVYLTVGTGIGAGVIANGKAVHGLMHPEGGHLLLGERSGKCPFHGGCLEGVASGSALFERHGKRGDELPVDGAEWDYETEMIARALVNYICILSPRRIILGGGLMENEAVFALVRTKAHALLNGYIPPLRERKTFDEYIVPPALGNRAGIAGAFKLAHQTEM